MIYVSDQDIKKMMAKRKRELATVKRSFPKYKPGDTVASYIAQYAVLNGPGCHVLDYGLGTYGTGAYNHPATVPSGPDVIEEPAE
jgi:hypothetical protein